MIVHAFSMIQCRTRVGKHRNFLFCLFLAAVTLALTASAQESPLWGSLKQGPYNVDFRSSVALRSSGMLSGRYPWDSAPGKMMPLVGTHADSGVAFVGVSVLSMETYEMLVDQTVLIHGDKIVALGRREDVKIPQSARAIEGKGRTLMPGLIDTHIHLRYSDSTALMDHLRAGITTARDMNGRPFILTWRNSIPGQNGSSSTGFQQGLR